MTWFNHEQMLKNKIIFFYIVAVSCALFICGFAYFNLIVLKRYDSKQCIETTDAIVVITGGSGRILEGFKLMSQNKASLFLISGVAHTTTKQEIIYSNPHYKIRKEDLILGHIATNTELNAYETKLFMQINGFNRMVLITNLSHMPRAELIFRMALPEKKICFHSVYKDESIYALLTEYTKYIATYIIHHVSFFHAIYSHHLMSISLNFLHNTNSNLKS